MPSSSNQNTSKRRKVRLRETPSYSTGYKRKKTPQWHLVKMLFVFSLIAVLALISHLKNEFMTQETTNHINLSTEGQSSFSPLDRRRILELEDSSSSTTTEGTLKTQSEGTKAAGSDSQNGETNSCPSIWGSNSTEKCEFVITNCEPDGLLDYLRFYYCECGDVKWLALIVFLFWLSILFYLLGHTAEEYFCPTLSKISQSLKLAPDVAGITILALGNGAPDLFSVFAAVNSGKSGIATGEILGSGNFITTVVMGLVVYSAPATVPWYQLLRDAGFYLFSVTLASFIAYNGEVYLWQPIMALVCYLSYVLFTIAGNYCGNNGRKKDHSSRGGLVFRYSEQGLLGGEEFDDDYEDESGLIPLEMLSGSEDKEGEDEEGSSISTASHLPVGGQSREHQHHHTGESLLERLGVVESSITDEDEEPTTKSTKPKQPVYLCPKWLLHHHHNQQHPQVGADDVFANIYNMQKGDFLDDGEDDGEADKSLKARFQRRLERLKYYIEWDEKSNCDKLIYVITWPFTLWLNLSIPNVERWSRTLRIFNPIFAPLVIMLATGTLSTTLFGVFPLWILVVAAGLVLSVMTYFTAERGRAPKFRSMWMLVGFLMCIIWIFLIANELVGVLQTVGLILTVSESVLGLTVLAMGNSVGDMIADVVVAKEGYPEMAIAACIGGPLFNMLIGLGVSFSWACLRALPSPYIIRMTPQVLFGFIFLGTSLLSTLIVVPLNGFSFPRKYGWYLFSLYIVFTIFNLLAEFGVLNIRVD